MDLTRAKTALILAFLALNLYLGYQLWYSSENYLSYLTVTAEEAQEVMTRLEEYNYKLNVSLPRQSQSMSLLLVQARALPEDEIVRAVFPGGSPPRQVQGQEVRYALAGESLVFPGQGRALYRKQGQPPLQEVQDLQRRGEEYLQEKGLWPAQARFGGIRLRVGGVKTLTYFLTYEGIPLYSSYLDLHFLGDQVSGFELNWLEPLGFSGENRYVLPSTQALLRFLEVRGPSPASEEITGLSLGYFSRDYDAQKWDMVPVWRISGSSGWVVYINAFSGEVEKS
jgi:regulatory protein YycI of two-component signal transduction system YycFG